MREYYVEEVDSYMRYEDLGGEDVAILFIHGIGCAGSFDYPQVVNQNEIRKHRCILVDLLGAGYSDKPRNFEYSVHAHALYLKKFVDSLGLKNFIIFGHSLGGAIAIELASMCVDNISHLVLSESNLDPSREGATSYEIASYSKDDFIKEGFKNIINESKKGGSSMWAATLKNWSPVAAYLLAKSALQGGHPSWRNTLYELPVSKGFIFGEHSLPVSDYDEMKKQGIHVEVVKDAGHSMAWENPEGVAEAILGCIKG